MEHLYYPSWVMEDLYYQNLGFKLQKYLWKKIFQNTHEKNIKIVSCKVKTPHLLTLTVNETENGQNDAKRSAF